MSSRLWTFTWLATVLAFRSLSKTSRFSKQNHGVASIRLTSTHLNSDGDLIGPVTGVVSLIIEAFPLFKKAVDELITSLPNVEPIFPNSVALNTHYVARPLIEEKIDKASLKLMSTKRGEYTVIVGPKGGGKSSIVAHVLGGKKGVVYLKISLVDSSTSFLRRLMVACGKIVEERVPLGLEVFLPVIEEAAKKRGGIPVTVVLEVEIGSSSQDVLASVKCISKELAVAANVIVILSKANAGLSFGDDERQQFIWVDEMSEEEAQAYARKINPNVSDAKLKFVFDKIGMLPLKIGLVMNDLADGMSAAEIVDQAVDRALTELLTFPHQQIIAALKASPDGVRSSAFRGVKDGGVYLAVPKQVVAAMREVGAIVYHLPSMEYRLATTAHKTAMLEYEPLQ